MVLIVVIGVSLFGSDTMVIDGWVISQNLGQNLPFSINFSTCYREGLEFVDSGYDMYS